MRAPAKLFLASSNPGKLAEYRALAAAHSDSLVVDLELLPGFDALPVFEENAPTFAENAAGKALHYSRLTDGLVFADDSGLGYEGAAIVFACVLALIAAAWFRTQVSRTLLFWLAFILTRPLGATLGDTKPFVHGGFNLGRITSSLVIAIFMIGCILCTSQRGGVHPARN